MTTEVLKVSLHEYIEKADDRHLAAIYTLVENEIDAPNKYDAATLEMFYQRREDHLSGESESYTADEAMAYVRAQRKTK